MQQQPDIYCPQCEVKPKLEDRWVCWPGCMTVWHTFWTGGVCPGCNHQWQDTQCLVCHRTSPHKAWYHYRDGQQDTATQEKALSI